MDDHPKLPTLGRPRKYSTEEAKREAKRAINARSRAKQREAKAGAGSEDTHSVQTHPIAAPEIYNAARVPAELRIPQFVDWNRTGPVMVTQGGEDVETAMPPLFSHLSMFLFHAPVWITN